MLKHTSLYSSQLCPNLGELGTIVLGTNTIGLAQPNLCTACLLSKNAMVSKSFFSFCIHILALLFLFPCNVQREKNNQAFFCCHPPVWTGLENCSAVWWQHEYVFGVKRQTPASTTTCLSCFTYWLKLLLQLKSYLMSVSRMRLATSFDQLLHFEAHIFSNIVCDSFHQSAITTILLTLWHSIRQLSSNKHVSKMARRDFWGVTLRVRLFCIKSRVFYFAAEK